MTRDEMRAFLERQALEDLPPRQDPQELVLEALSGLRRTGKLEYFTVMSYRHRVSPAWEVSVSWEDGSLVYRYVPRLCVIADVMEE